MNKTNNSVVPGVYRHFKGGTYCVFVSASHTEIDQELVVYASMHGDRKLWARPVKKFLQTVEVGGEMVPRFSFVRPFRDDE
ncbi:hypothetical protein AB833_24120 [Chromatiales bacterium (ex Bugula neritina AB1)]|nr:hypothetical protein AB833_24120 [Chromatiales bacterium (ex Bugula neritina AB1)]